MVLLLLILFFLCIQSASQQTTQAHIDLTFLVRPQVKILPNGKIIKNSPLLDVKKTKDKLIIRTEE